MSTFEDAMSFAVQLSQSDRDRLARALGVNVAAPKNTLPLATGGDLSKTNPAAWAQKERGHAVLVTDFPGGAIPPGPAAIQAMWPATEPAQVHDFPHSVTSLPAGSPVLVHTAVAEALARGSAAVQSFWSKPGVEIRLATGTYLKLLETCQSPAEQERVRAFIQPYAVLSLGPMASSKAVELMLSRPTDALQALDALIAATALAHEIPLLTLDPRPFTFIPNLLVVGL